MADDQRRVEICSYRAVFDVQRRIYRVDRLRLNPSGVPLRGIAYAISALITVALAAQLPLTGAALGVLPWHLRFVALPVGIAVLATMVRVEGRPLHVAARALIGHVCAPRRVSRFEANRSPDRWRPSDLTLIPDGSGPAFRRMRFTGPGAVIVRAPCTRTSRRRHGRADVALTQRAGRRPTSGKVLVLGYGASVEIRPAGGGRR